MLHEHAKIKHEWVHPILTSWWYYARPTLCLHLPVYHVPVSTPRGLPAYLCLPLKYSIFEMTRWYLDTSWRLILNLVDKYILRSREDLLWFIFKMKQRFVILNVKQWTIRLVLKVCKIWIKSYNEFSQNLTCNFHNSELVKVVAWVIYRTCILWAKLIKFFMLSLEIKKNHWHMVYWEK